jgi:hypothetical protein
VRPPPNITVEVWPGVPPLTCAECGRATARLARLRGVDGQVLGAMVICALCERPRRAVPQRPAAGRPRQAVPAGAS